jgi:hypothetical protein
MKSQCFNSAGGKQQQAEARERDENGSSIAHGSAIETTQRPHCCKAEQNDPPPRGDAEKVQEPVGEPCAYFATEVAGLAARDAMRPSRVRAVESAENERKIKSRRDQDEQP